MTTRKAARELDPLMMWIYRPNCRILNRDPPAGPRARGCTKPL